MIRTILLDLDNTLLDFNQAERKALARTLEKLGIEPQESTLRLYSQLNMAQWKLLEQGKLTRPQVKTRRYQLLFEKLGVERSAEQAARLYEGFLAEGHFFMDGAQEVLEELSPRYRLYLVTNGTARVQQSRLGSAGIGRYFQGYFISEAIGFDKPRKEFFDFCFSVIPDFCREETVIVGDSLSSDIQGGKNAGIRTIWLRPEGDGAASLRDGVQEPVPDYILGSLRELPALAARLSE